MPGPRLLMGGIGMKLYDIAYEPVIIIARNPWLALLLTAAVVILAAVLILVLRKRRKAKEKR